MLELCICMQIYMYYRKWIIACAKYERITTCTWTARTGPWGPCRYLEIIQNMHGLPVTQIPSHSAQVHNSLKFASSSKFTKREKAKIINNQRFHCESY